MSGATMFSVPREPTRADLLTAIRMWEAGGSVTGRYTAVLHRYWKLQGPLVSSQAQVDDYEFVRRTLESAHLDSSTVEGA